MLAASLVATRLQDVARARWQGLSPLCRMGLEIGAFWAVAITLVLGVACA